MDIQAASIFTLIVINVVLLVYLGASRSELNYWKERAASEKEERIEWRDRCNVHIDTLAKQNRLIRAMSLSNGFESPIEDEDDE